MNMYIIVEGDRTELSVYPKWLQILAPSLQRVSHKDDLKTNNYYLFSGKGIPSIYNHICNAIEDINALNATRKTVIEYLMICMDTEEETREYILQRIYSHLDERGLSLNPPCQLVLFEHRVCMETWFLGNSKLLRQSVQSPLLLDFRNFFNVREMDPEEMENMDGEKFATKAQFHFAYLTELFKENHIKYTKKHPDEVCKKYYLDNLIDRYKNKGHIASFGRWYDFITGLPSPDSSAINTD